MEKRITAADLRAGKKLCGAWAHLGSNLSAEILAKAGYDVIIPDMEHAPYSLPALVSVLQAVESSGCFTLVRAPWNDQVAIKQILDCGADGIHIPYVNTRQEAEYAVRACKYPPQGVRGVATSQRATCYGMEKMAYLTRANRDVVVMLAIETPEAVANIDDIASVEGVDGIFIGPFDLSISTGMPGDFENPQFKAALERILAACHAAGKPCLIFTGDGAASSGSFRTTRISGTSSYRKKSAFSE